jgi:thiamine pyrophosphokinase
MASAEEITSLYSKLEAKKLQISRLLSSTYGIGDFDSLNAEERQRLDDEVDQMIEHHEDALRRQP